MTTANKLDMKAWIKAQFGTGYKKPVPVLSFPCISLMGITVKELVADSDIQAKGMKLVADRCPTGAAVSMMDLSVEAEAFGCKIDISEDEVPTVLGCLIKDEDDAKALKVPPVGTCRTGLYTEAVGKAKKMITDRPVFAGVIGPFSLAGRMMEMSEIMVNCYEEPDMVHITLEKCTEYLIAYIKEYKKVGADGVVMAEPAAGLLSPALCDEFSSKYVKQIKDAVADDDFVFVYHNCGNAVVALADTLMSIGADVYHVGNAIDIEAFIKAASPDVVVMGNIDPANVFRLGTPELVRSTTKELLERCSKYPNFVISSGCDIPPLSPWENIDAFFAAVKEFYA